MESFVKNIEVKQLTTNQDLIAVLEKLGDASIILMGDTYQIEAIGYGNWFSIFPPKTQLLSLFVFLSKPKARSSLSSNRRAGLVTLVMHFISAAS